MKKLKHFFLLFSTFFVIFGMSMAAEEDGSAIKPVAVSPGSDMGVAVVSQGCPTFSWSAVERASGYRVEVFEAVGSDVLMYEEIEAVSPPVLIKEIKGPALSWTPSADERLSHGVVYVWYVAAVDSYGQWTWSGGRIFKVELSLGLSGVEDALKETMKEHGVSEDVISEVLKDMKSDVKDATVGGVDLKDKGGRTEDKVEKRGHESDSNTWYGQYAGNSITTGGYNNSFFGNSAGYSTSTGDYNTFMGCYAGSSNIAGLSNTFIGGLSGYDATGSSNVFLGYQSGYNETGSNRLYIENSDSSSPLIYGEFDNNIVTINGKLGVGTKTPSWPFEILTTGENAGIKLIRTNGANLKLNVTLSQGQIGTRSNHKLNFITNNTSKMSIGTDGYIGIGTNTPSHPIQVITANGAYLNTSGNWVNPSTRDLKENIQELTADEAMDALSGLNPVTYNYKVDKEETYVGFIAEDVPDLVAVKGRKGMVPMDVVAVLTRVVQKQQEMISELQERIVQLEKK